MRALLLALTLPLLAHAADERRPDHTANASPLPTTVVIARHQLGSGTPGLIGLERATHMGDGIYHAPQYLPLYPTASVTWPRVIDVMCEPSNGLLVCDDYAWALGTGRPEYVFFRPRLRPAPQVIERVVTVPGPERTILVEVPRKPKGE